MVGSTLAHPVFSNGRGKPAERYFRPGSVIVIGPGQAHAHGCCRFRFERKVCNNVRHGRLINQPGAKRAAVTDVPHGLGYGLTHARGRAQNAIQPGLAHHTHDGFDSPTWLTNPPAVGVEELYFSGGIGAVARLVLQPLNHERITLFCRGPAGCPTG